MRFLGDGVVAALLRTHSSPLLNHIHNVMHYEMKYKTRYDRISIRIS